MYRSYHIEYSAEAKENTEPPPFVNIAYAAFPAYVRTEGLRGFARLLRVGFTLVFFLYLLNRLLRPLRPKHYDNTINYASPLCCCMIDPLPIDRATTKNTLKFNTE